jgi:hypothetical protein
VVSELTGGTDGLTGDGLGVGGGCGGGGRWVMSSRQVVEMGRCEADGKRSQPADANLWAASGPD